MGTRRSFLKLLGKVGIVTGVSTILPTAILTAKEIIPKRKLPSSPASIPSKYWDFEKGEAKVDELVRDFQNSKINK